MDLIVWKSVTAQISQHIQFSNLVRTSYEQYRGSQTAGRGTGEVRVTPLAHHKAALSFLALAPLKRTAATDTCLLFAFTFASDCTWVQWNTPSVTPR